MEESALDLESLSRLMLSLRSQLDKKTLEEIALVDLSRLQEAILETLGVAWERLNPAEQEMLTFILQSELQTARKAAD